MQAYGSDRLRRDGDRWILSSRIDKGWKARVEKTLTSAEFPGTAVLCDEAYFEVVAVESIPNGLRYVLEPWREEHAIRVTDRYDAETEEARLVDRRDAIARERTRKSLRFLGIFAGHLPADVQEQIGHQYGVLPQRLTYASCAFLYLVIGGIAMLAVDKLLRGEVPGALIIIGFAVFVETSLRFLWAFKTTHPIGSFEGLLAYTIYAAVTGKLVIAPKLLKNTEAPPEHIATADAIAMREPLITLLPRGDQERVAQRFPYDYARLSPAVAAVVLLFASLGAVTAGREGHTFSAALAAAVAVEQVYRLIEFRSHPAGSVLGLIVRPLMRKLL